MAEDKYVVDMMDGRLFTDESDRDPTTKAPGACVQVRHVGSGKSTGVTVHCAVDHEHSRDCVVTALKAKTVPTGDRVPRIDPATGKQVTVKDPRGWERDPSSGDDVEVFVDVPAWDDVKITPLQKAKREIKAQIDDEEAKKASHPVKVKPLPQVEKIREGKKVMVADTRIKAEELS